MKPSDASLQALYGNHPETLVTQKRRYAALQERFFSLYPQHTDARFFSAPGRTELVGNHTDHQSGRVLAASVNLDTVAIASPNGSMIVRVQSDGYAPIEVSLQDMEIHPEAFGSTEAIIRGIAARMKALGCGIGGFDAAVTSTVFSGSGLSSSAAFEVLICHVFDCLFGSGDMSPILRAQISQYAENVFFGKPSGLMDQMASSVGGIVAIDFKDETPEVTALSYDFLAKGYTLAVVSTGGSHDDLTDAYAAIPEEMGRVAAYFGAKRLREVAPDTFEKEIPALRKAVSDRAILRAMHFFAEDQRVPKLVAAMEENDLPAFFDGIIASGKSSWMLLQNVWVSPRDQPLALALALSERHLQGKGAWRVHGGGFAGTILAFIPTETYPEYARQMDAVFGKNACCPLNIRSVGAYELMKEV